MASGGDEFVGRERERSALSEAVFRGSPGVVVVRGGPGTGKSTLISRWLNDLQGIRHGFERIFAGSAGRSANARSPQSLLSRLLEFVSPEEQPRDAPLVDQLLHALRRRVALIVIDGIDTFSMPGESSPEREASATDLWMLLRECGRAGPSRVILSTRVELPGLDECRPAREVTVGNLSPADGAQLLHALGVRSRRNAPEGRDDPELQAAASEVGGHPLALSLLGQFLVRAHDGDVRRRELVALRPGPQSIPGIVAAFERWFGEGPERALLRLMALTDGLVSREELQALADRPELKPLVAGLSDAGGHACEWALKILHDCGLIKLRGDGQINTPRLVQDCLRKDIARRWPEALAEG